MTRLATQPLKTGTASRCNGRPDQNRMKGQRMSLNWEILPPSLVLTGDSPRARRNDPHTSHRAADRSQASRTTVKLAVLRLVNDFENLTGEEINGWYGSRADNGIYPMAKWDTPRKRASDLALDGLLTADRSNKLEAVYSLTDAGRVYLEQVSA